MSAHLVHKSTACFVSGCFVVGGMPITKMVAYFYLISRLQNKAVRSEH